LKCTQCINSLRDSLNQKNKFEVEIPFFLADLGVVDVESVPGPDECPPSRSQFSLAESSSSCDDCGCDVWELSRLELKWVEDDIELTDCGVQLLANLTGVEGNDGSPEAETNSLPLKLSSALEFRFETFI
jgi:hypothetical protein